MVGEILLLLPEMPWKVLVDIVEKGFEWGRRRRFGFGDRCLDSAPECLSERRVSSVIPESSRFHVTSEAIDGIAFPPGLGLRCFAVAGVVVRGRMSAASIAHPFDERRSAALPRTFDGLSHDVVHRQGVGAVDAHAIETIRLRFDRDSSRSRSAT